MDFLIGFLNTVIVLVSVFMVIIILIQRGKGGGLAGAFGGVGGSSAFGTKAGDVFTKITIGVAIGWMFALMLLVILMNGRADSVNSGWGDESSSSSKALPPSKASATPAPAGTTPAPADLAAPVTAAPAPVAAPAPGPAGLTPSPATDVGVGAPPTPEPVKPPAPSKK